MTTKEQSRELVLRQSQKTLNFLNDPPIEKVSMTEFLDFLRHKFAYVAIGEFKPGTFEEAQQLYEKAVSTYTHGFKGAYLLREPGTDKGIAIIFWESLEDMKANQNEAYEAILHQMAHLFTKAPSTSFYEVCSEIASPTAEV